MPKFVFSRTLRNADGNTTVVHDDVAATLQGLVARSRRGVVAFGGPTFAATRMGLGLVDEYQLFVHPALLGGGTPLFGGIHERRRLELVASRRDDDAVVAIRYADPQASAR